MISIAMILVIAIIGGIFAWLATENAPIRNLSSIPQSIYLTSNLGPGSYCSGPEGYAPCFGWNQSGAYVFTCRFEAMFPSGCKRDIASNLNPQYKYEITVWFPIRTLPGQSFPNCSYLSNGDPTNTYHANCISINWTSFIVTEPAPPIPVGTALL